MKKHALKKEFHREIRKSLNRFLSIFLIVALGVAFFSGIQAAAPDMRLTADFYYDDSNLMDLRVISTLGLTADDLESLREVDGVTDVEGCYMEDVYCEEGEVLKVLHVESLPESMNQVTAAAGRLPDKAGECFLDEAFATENGYEPGDRITFLVDSEEDSSLKHRSFTVAGYGYSPTYISFERGTTTLGTGSLAGFVYVVPEEFDAEVYSVAYLGIDAAKAETVYTDAYDAVIEEITDRVEMIADARCEVRYAQVQSEAQEKLDDARSDLADGKQELADAKEELAEKESEAESELAQAESELVEGESELADGRKKLEDAEKEIEDGEQELADGEQELADNEKTLSDARGEVDSAREKLNSGESEYQNGLREYQDSSSSATAELVSAQKQIDEGKKQLEAGWKEYREQLAVLEDGQKQLEDAEKKLTDGQKSYDDAYAGTKKQLDDGMAQYELGKKQIEEGRTALAQGEQQLSKRQKEYEAGLAQYEAGKKQYEAGLVQLSEGKGQLEEAQKQIAELEAGYQQVQKQSDGLWEQYGDAQGQVVSLRAAYDAENGRYQEIEAAYLSSQAEAAAFRDQERSARQACEEAQANRDAASAQKSLKEGVKTEKDAEYAGLLSQIELTEDEEEKQKLQAQAAALLGELDVLAGEISALDAQISQWSSEASAKEQAAQDAQAAALEIENRLPEQKLAVDEAASGLASSLAAAEQAEAAAAQLLTAAQQASGIAAGLKSQLDAANAALSSERTKLEEAEAQLTSSKQVLDSTQEELAAGKAQLDGARQQLSEKRAELASGEAQLRISKEQLDAGYQALSDAKNELDAGWKELNAKKKELASGKKQLAEGKKKLEASQRQLTLSQEQVDNGNRELAAARRKLTSARQELDLGWAELLAAQDQLSDGEGQLEDGRKQLSDARKELSDAIEKLADGKQELANNEKKIKDGWTEYEDGKKEAEKKIAEAKQEIADAEKELADAEKEIADAEKEIADIRFPKWYVQDRSSLPENSGFGENAERIGNIAKVFPVLFFLVAALISLTTMTRMVEEERTQIGTLKALGYSRKDIASKYLKYAFLATVGGSLFGILTGEKLLPWIIVNAYGIIYTYLPKILIPYNWEFGAIASAAALFCTLGATLSSCYRELQTVPAQLMRPPAPKDGKRVLLEHIPFLWRRISFTWKSTIRNLMRYKKRFLMTVIGIGGCMGLLLVGFGLSDSIMDIGRVQYQELQLYDAIAVVDTDASAGERETVSKTIQEDARISVSGNYYMQREELQTDGKKKWAAYIYVPEDTDTLKDFFCFRRRGTQETYELTDEGAIITEKLADEVGIREGDTVLVKREDGDPVEIPVSHICENYLYHYIYLTPALYEQVYGEEPEYNSIFFRSTESQEVIEDIGQSLLAQDGVLNITYTRTMAGQIDSMLGALDLVLVVLIVSAGLLAFVVLYNLNNININERRRELATLKVLGFYNGEVGAYVYRENVLLTIIGAALGIFIGKFLHMFVITTVEVDTCMFARTIKPESYVIGTLFTFGFSIIVNFVMYFKLKKIDMVESLKTVE